MNGKKKILERANKDKARGKAPTTQAGELVREEMHHIRKGRHGARSARQAVAIGLSKARRSGVKMPLPKLAGPAVRKKAALDTLRGRVTPKRKPSPARSRAVRAALRREARAAATARALGRQARAVAIRRGPVARAVAAKKAARTKRAVVRGAVARKIGRARRTRARAH